MRKGILTLVLLFGFLTISQGQGSLNMSLLGSWDDDSLPLRLGGAYSDCWGYHDNMSNEFAVIGSIDKVHFFDVTNPANPVMVDEFTPGAASVWRDFKSFGKVMYGVADEGAEGLAMYSLVNLPNSVSLISQTTAFFNRCHNLFIDEATAKMYACGTNTKPEGLIVFDVSNSSGPTQLASVNLPGGYVHDLFARNDTVYCNHGNAGLYVYDFSTPTSPVLLGTLTSYPDKGYNHSSWLTADGNHLVFTDENHGKKVKIADVSALNDITVSTDNLFGSTLLAPAHTNSIAHNPVIIGDIVYLSYYHDGIQLFDISNPNNVTRVGYYDTEPNNTTYSSYYGSWGVYPLLPSGNVIAADILHGLLILDYTPNSLPAQLLDFQLVKGLEGIILHWKTAQELNNALFEVQRSQNGIHFDVIGTVPGVGTSSEVQVYSFLDRNPLPGYNYYRLRQIDWDGSATYSDMRAAEWQVTGLDWVYPNRVAAGEWLQIDLGDVNLRRLLFIRDLRGKTIWQGEVSGRAEITLPQTLSAGIYFIQAEGYPTKRILVR